MTERIDQEAEGVHEEMTVATDDDRMATRKVVLLAASSLNSEVVLVVVEVLHSNLRKRLANLLLQSNYMWQKTAKPGSHTRY